MTADGLERLAKLHSDGALTDQEFESAKQHLLGGSPDQSASSPPGVPASQVGFALPQGSPPAPQVPWGSPAGSQVSSGSPARTPWYARRRFWTGRFVPLVGVVVGLALGFVWFVYGGLPRGFDKYGSVPVPGQQVVALPAGEVTLDHEDDAYAVQNGASLASAPDGMQVRVTPVHRPGDVLPIESIPSWLFTSTSNSRGHQPWGKVNLPSAGRYLVETTDAAAGGFKRRPNAKAPATPMQDSGPAIALGEKPWTPFGSILLGAILCALLVPAVLSLPHLITEGIARRR